MGKGDKRTAKGKRSVGSYGNSRPKVVKKSVVSTKSKSVAIKKVEDKKVTEKKSLRRKLNQLYFRVN